MESSGRGSSSGSTSLSSELKGMELCTDSMFTATARVAGQGPRRQHTNSTPVEPSGSFLSSRLVGRLIGRYPSLGYGVPVHGGWMFCLASCLVVVVAVWQSTSGK